MGYLWGVSFSADLCEKGGRGRAVVEAGLQNWIEGSALQVFIRER
jgi:hypothetical protein